MRILIPPVMQVLGAAGMSWAASTALPSLSYAWPYIDLLAKGAFFAGALMILPSLLSFARAKTTVNPVSPTEATHLVTTGMYRFSRNPMYLGFLLFLLGWALSLQNYSALVPVILFPWTMTVLQIKPEEEALTELFGAEYEAYKDKVRRWI